MSSPAPLPNNLSALAGPLLIGSFFNWGLYGSLCVQIYIYYIAFPKDRPFVKCLVFGLFAIETAQTIIVMHDAFSTFAIGFNDSGGLSKILLSWVSVPLMTGIIGFAVQIFFAYRIRVLSGYRILGCIVGMIALAQGTAAVTSAVQAKQARDITKLQTNTHLTAGIWLVGSAVCDILISAFMTYFLLRKSSGFAATRVLALRLIRLTVETGSITATVATIDLILFLAIPDSSYYVVPALSLGKMYSNTALAILNSRMHIDGGRESPESRYMGNISAMWNSYERSDEAQARRVVNIHPAPVGLLTSPNGGIHVQKDIWNDDIHLGRVESSKAGNDADSQEDPSVVSKGTLNIN